MDTKSIRERIQSDEKELSYERPWPLSFQRAHEVVYDLLDKVEELEAKLEEFHRLHPHEDDYVAHATDQMVQAQSKTKKILEEYDKLIERLKNNSQEKS